MVVCFSRIAPLACRGLPIRCSDDTGADVAMRRYRRSAPAIPGVYRARYRRALRPGGLLPLPRDPPGRHDAFPPSYARAPAAFPAVLRDDPRPSSPPSYETIPGRLTRDARGDTTYGAIPGSRRLPRLTTPVLRSPPSPRSTTTAETPPSYEAIPGRRRLTLPVLRSRSARRLPRLRARRHRSPDRPAVLRPPSYDPRDDPLDPRDRRPLDPVLRGPAFLAAFLASIAPPPPPPPAAAPPPLRNFFGMLMS